MPMIESFLLLCYQLVHFKGLDGLHLFFQSILVGFGDHYFLLPRLVEIES